MDIEPTHTVKITEGDHGLEFNAYPASTARLYVDAFFPKRNVNDFDISDVKRFAKELYELCKDLEKPESVQEQINQLWSEREYAENVIESYEYITDRKFSRANKYYKAFHHKDYIGSGEWVDTVPEKDGLTFYYEESTLSIPWEYLEMSDEEFNNFYNAQIKEFEETQKELEAKQSQMEEEQERMLYLQLKSKFERDTI